MFGRRRRSRPPRGRNVQKGGWTPLNLANVADIYHWLQPSLFGTDNSFTSGKPHYVFDRAGSGHIWNRADNNPAGMASLMVRGGATKRPYWQFTGVQIYGTYDVAPPVTQTTQTAATWCVGGRVIVDAVGGSLFGWNYPTASYLKFVPGANGFSMSDGSHSVACTKTLVAGTEYAFLATALGAGNVEIRIQTVGQQDQETVTSSALTAAPITGSYQILGGNGATLDAFKGGNSELLYVLSAPNVTDRDQSMRYFCNPMQMPLSTAGKLWCLELGNSLGLSELEGVVAGMSTPLFATNHSVGGYTIADIISHWSTDGDLAIPDPEATGSPVICLLEEGINSLASYGASDPSTAVANTEADFTTLIGMIRAINPNILIPCCTLVGRVAEGSGGPAYIYHGGGYEAARLLVNTWLRANALSLGIVIVDTGADASIGPEPPITGDTWRDSEGTAPNRLCVHRNGAGRLVAYPIIRAQMGFP
jgi:hypothetical protein